MRRKREHGDIVKGGWRFALYGAFFIVRVKRTWITCTILLNSCSRKVAGLHSVECVILLARKTFSSLSPASVLSSEQELREPKALILFADGGKEPVKEASWNNQNISFLRQLIFFLDYPVPEKKHLIEILTRTRLGQKETETAWAVFLFLQI